MKELNRREFLALSGASVALLALAACGGAPSTPVVPTGKETKVLEALNLYRGELSPLTLDSGLNKAAEEVAKMILLNNNFLGNVRQWQAMFFNRRYSFTPMMNPDYMKIASAYDIPARRVMTREELAKAIDEMIATDGPFLLEACVEEEGNVMPMTPPGGSVNQMLLEC